MKKYFIILIILHSFISAKILVVNSYSKLDQCGKPQLDGFLSTAYENGYSANEFVFNFLDIRTSSKNEIKKRVQHILKNLDNYDEVITFDDAAFKLIGIPASKKKHYVIFSGLNKSITQYKKEYNLNMNYISGVFEKLHYLDALKMYNKYYQIKRVALFYSYGVGEILKKQIQNELKDSKFNNKIDYMLVRNIDELKLKAKQINSNQKYTLFTPLALSVEDKNNKKLSFLDFKDIYLRYIKKPDISMNKTFIHLGFLGFSGVDFYKMGKQTGEIFISKRYKQKSIIEDAKNFSFFINIKRSKEVGLKLDKDFLLNQLDEIF